MKKLFLCVFLLCLLLPLNLLAATEAEKQAAIDAGLAYLASIQNSDGSFDGGTLDYLLSQTGSALLAFLEEKPNWGANAAAYQAVVDNGLNYIFNNANVVTIGPQAAGNPDGDGNGVGVKFYPGVYNTRDTYVTGIVLPAIASSGTPDAVVGTGPLTGWTYKQVVQNAVDYFAFGQSDAASGTYRGGWRYYANFGNSDQSTTQWPVIAGLFASKMGVSYPQFVKDELAFWTDYIQNPATGAAGYTSPTFSYGEMNETGALLLMQDFIGLPTGNPDVQAALNYINTNWQIGLGGYDGNIGHPYAMWAIYKGLESTIGLDDTTAITNLRPDPGDVDNPDHPYNWWEDYCEYLVSTQLGGGNWTGYSYWGSPLATAWYINILAATEIPDGQPVPEPATMLLVGSGLLGMGVFARRKRKK